MKVVKSEATVTPGRKVWSKWVETRKDPNKLWYESSGLSPREGRTQLKSRTKCVKRCGRSSGCFEPYPRQRSLQRVLLANARFADLKARRNRDTISFYVVPPKDLCMKRKIWSLLKNRCGIRGTSHVFATHVEEGLNEQRSSERRSGAVVVLEGNVGDAQCSLGKWLHSRHFRCQSKRP